QTNTDTNTLSLPDALPISDPDGDADEYTDCDPDSDAYPDAD
ncbi:MAG: hypothetical protein RL518_48, partial [Pseudomonadota bacterium]